MTQSERESAGLMRRKQQFVMVISNCLIYIGVSINCAYPVHGPSCLVTNRDMCPKSGKVQKRLLGLREKAPVGSLKVKLIMCHDFEFYKVYRSWYFDLHWLEITP